MMSHDEAYRLALDTIGLDALKRLHDAGLTVVVGRNLDAYEQEMASSNERMKELARASMRAADLRSVICEIYMVRDPSGNEGLRVVVCDPSGDEEATLAKIASLMNWSGEQPPKKTGQRVARIDPPKE